jgi:integrase
LNQDVIKLPEDTLLSPDDKLPLSSWIANPYIKAATSNNTRKAYQSDIRHFEKWGAQLPAQPEIVVRYLQAFAQTLNPRTLGRRLTAIKQWHVYQGFPDPTGHSAVQKTLIGISRLHGKPKDKARPLSIDDLLIIAKHLSESDTLADYRDNALIQIGYFGAFRRSELVSINIEHIEWKKEGVDILIPQSKTDPHHQGQYCGIPYGRSPLCPVMTLKQWLDLANINTGPIFREIKRGEKLKTNALTPFSVNQILKKRAKACGMMYADQFSGHSLRRGLATDANKASANLAAIMRQGRWKQVNTIMEYVDATNRFADNAASKILEAITISSNSTE